MFRVLAPILSLALFAGVSLADEGEGTPGRFAKLAANADAKSMAKLFHYPPSYSEAERREDQEAVAESLEWLLSKTGTPQDVAARNVPADFYEVGVFGGDNPYWESISPIDEIQFLYDVTFPNLGPGYLKILLLRPKSGSSGEIHMAGIGIPTTTPGAKERAIELVLGLIEQSGTPTPPGIREALEQQLQPSHAAPGS